MSSRNSKVPGTSSASARAEAVMSCRAAESREEMAKVCKFDIAVAFIGTEVPMVPEARAASAGAMGGGAWGTGPGDHSSRKRESPMEGNAPGFLPAGHRVRPDASRIGGGQNP